MKPTPNEIALLVVLAALAAFLYQRDRDRGLQTARPQTFSELKISGPATPTIAWLTAPGT